MLNFIGEFTIPEWFKDAAIAAIVVAAILILLILLSIIAGIVTFHIVFYRNDDDTFDNVDLTGTHYEPYVEPLRAAIKRMKAEEHTKISITSDDGKRLYGDYFDRGSDTLFIMVHGYHSNPYNNFSVLASDILDRGYNILMIFQRGHLESEGHYTTMGIKEQYDVLKWVARMSAEESIKNIVLYGTSMGSATVGFLSDKIPAGKVKVLCMDCGYTSFMAQYMDMMSSPIRKFFRIGYPIGWLFARVFLGVNITESTVDSLQNCKLPVFFIHGEADKYVSIGFTAENFAACNTDKKLVTVPNAGHTTSMLVGGESVRGEFFEFVGKYI